MRTRTQWVKRRAVALAIAGISVVAIAGTAAAGPAGDVKSFTGCLVAGDGVIIKVKEGNSPKSACSSGQTIARLSGGDLTKISVTGALTLPDGPGTGESGDVTIGLKPEFTLPANCVTGRVAKWNGSAWVCGVDNGTTYTASTGLDLSAGDAFSIEPGYRIPGKACSTSGEFSTGFDSDGDLLCASPPSSQGAQAYAASVGAVTVAGLTTIISKTLPVGSYVLSAHINLGNPGSEGADGYCDISGDRGNVYFSDVHLWQSNVTLTSAITHPGGAVLVTCTEEGGNINVLNASLTAIKVTSIG